MRVLIVGLNPSRKGGSSRSLTTLYSWMDILGLNIVSFTNLYEGYEINKNASQIDAIREYSKQYDKIIALGEVVFNSLLSMDIYCVKLPHPSGLNRKLNDQNFVHEQLVSCKNSLYGGNNVLRELSNR